MSSVARVTPKCPKCKHPLQLKVSTNQHHEVSCWFCGFFVMGNDAFLSQFVKSQKEAQQRRVRAGSDA